MLHLVISGTSVNHWFFWHLGTVMLQLLFYPQAHVQTLSDYYTDCDVFLYTADLQLYFGSNDCCEIQCMILGFEFPVQMPSDAVFPLIFMSSKNDP